MSEGLRKPPRLTHIMAQKNRKRMWRQIGSENVAFVYIKSCTGEIFQEFSMKIIDCQSKFVYS